MGKSTIALNLAVALRSFGAVGILDADVYGPNVPHMLGIHRESWTTEWTLARAGGHEAQRPIPAVDRYGLKIASAGFLLGEDQAMGLSAMGIDLLLKQLVRFVAWGALEFLVVDMPPGTADVAHTIMRELKITGAILVVTPQEVAHLDARKAITMLRHAKVPILGAIQNMSGLVCPRCGERISLYPEVTEDRAIWGMSVDKLGEIIFTPALANAAEAGVPLTISSPDSAEAQSFAATAAAVMRRLSD